MTVLSFLFVPDEYVDAVKPAIVDPPLKLIRNELDDAVR